jgi:hypothetical protein
VGFALWRSAEGELYVTFPSRAFCARAERKYFDYLRAIESDSETAGASRSWILGEYRKAGRPA